MQPVLAQRVRTLRESATLAVDARAKALVAAGEDVVGFGAGEGVGAPGCLRLSYALADADLARGLERLATALAPEH